MTHFSFVGTVFARISHTSPTNAATFVSKGLVGTHTTPSPNRAHSASQGETRGVSGGGAISTLGPFCVGRRPCAAGWQNGVLCRFWALVGCAPEECREPAGQRCAYVCRCSEAPRPRGAALSLPVLVLHRRASEGCNRCDEGQREKFVNVTVVILFVVRVVAAV